MGHNDHSTDISQHLKRLKTYSLILAGLILLISAIPVQASDFSDTAMPDPSMYQPDTVIVRFAEQNFCSASETAHSAIDAEVTEDLSGLVPGMQVIELPEGTSVEEAVDYYNSLPGVEYAEPDYYVHALAEPDDPEFENLWGMKNTGQVLQEGQSFGGMLSIYNDQAGTPGADMSLTEAWNTTTGSSDVTIAVVDSGVMYTHPDLAGNIWRNTGEIPDNGIDDDGNGYIDDIRGWDYVDDDNNPMDFNGHGSHCAGTIAGVGNNSEGVCGVMWNAEIMPVRVLDTQGFGTVHHSIAAIEYATEMGADVISCSFGGAEGSQAYRDAIRISSALVVCAAGNDGTDNDVFPMFPASYNSPNVLSVGALDNQDNYAIFSNYGIKSVDVAAPGVGILSTVPEWSATYEDDISESSAEQWQTLSYMESANWSGDLMSGTDRYAMGISGVNVTLTWFESPFSDLDESALEFVTAYTLREGTDKLQVLVSTTNFSSYSSYNDMMESDDCYIADLITGSSHREIVSRYVGLDRYARMLGDEPLYIGYLYYSKSRDSFAWLDSFTITSYRDPVEDYEYYSGTSMATPMVSGVAGLIQSVNQNLTSEETRDIIISSVDTIPSLEGKVCSGGKVNASRAVMMAEATLPRETTLDLNENGIDADIGDLAYVSHIASRIVTTDPRADYLEPHGLVDDADADYISDIYLGRETS